MSAMAPRNGAVINTRREVAPERKAHSVVALVDISIPQNLKTHPSGGTITVAKYMGKRAAITVVAKAEFAQSYIYHAKTFLFLSLFISLFYNQLEPINLKSLPEVRRGNSYVYNLILSLQSKEKIVDLQKSLFN